MKNHNYSNNGNSSVPAAGTKKSLKYTLGKRILLSIVLVPCSILLIGILTNLVVLSVRFLLRVFSN